MQAQWQSAGSNPRYIHYGRRRGRKLRARRQSLIETFLPNLRLPFMKSGALDVARFREFETSYSELWLEIGFGQGEHIAAQSQRHPDVLMLGCEPYVNGVSSLLSKAQAEGITNIRIHDDDARELLEALPEACIGRLYLLFADPWPKRRHHKRRFISKNNLDRIVRVLVNGAELRFATDHSEYARWTLWHAIKHESLEWLANHPTDWQSRPQDWVPTRYEKKALAEGRACTYLTFRRRSRCK